MRIRRMMRWFLAVSPRYGRRRRRILPAAATVATATMFLTAATGGASAQTAAELGGASKPMTLVSVKRSVSGPDADGNVQVELTNGQVISVPAEDEKLVLNPAPHPAGDGGMQPDNTVYGNCGSSYIYLSHKSNGHPVRMTTGFRTYTSSIAYNWFASIRGPNYSYNYHASGGLNYRKSWDGSHDSTANYPRGWYFGQVYTFSYAILWWGGICVSGGPSQLTYLSA